MPVRSIALWAGPLLALALASWLQAVGYGWPMAVVLFVAVLCVVWWVFEPIPIPVTSLLPLAVLPLRVLCRSSSVIASSISGQTR